MYMYMIVCKLISRKMTLKYEFFAVNLERYFHEKIMLFSKTQFRAN